eukprot:453082_1
MMDYLWALLGWPGILLPLSALAAYVLSSSPYAGLNVLRKIRLAITGLLHMLLSTDKRRKKDGGDPRNVEQDRRFPIKHIIFVRHGESEWNEVFNCGFGLSFFIRLARAIIAELVLLPTRDSVFFDSPLSEAGLKQTQELTRFLSKPNPVPNAAVDEVVAILRGDNGHAGSSILTTSNLRRSIATCLICLWDRLNTTNEKIHVLSCLQEITLNIDGMSLLEEKETPDGGVADALQGGEKTDCFDATHNKGTKPLNGNGINRMYEFCSWAYNRNEETIICSGHSYYFREFFRTFLPKDVDHIAKTKKMVNCGVVAFDLVKGVDSSVGGVKKTMYRIVPDSITNIYGGYCK